MVGVAWVTDCWCVVRIGHADGGDSFPQTSAPFTIHTVTSQARDLTILGQQESHIVCRIVMLRCWASSSQHFEGL